MIQHPSFRPDQHAAAIASFNEHNYVVIADAFSTTQIEFLNAFVDRSKKQIPDEWGIDKADVHSHGQILVNHPQLDPFIRPPSTFPLVESILGPESRFAQFDFRDVPVGIGEKAAMHFHRDRGAVPKDYWDQNKHQCIFLCAIYYLTDVGEDDTSFCVVPNSQAYETLEEAQQQLGKKYQEVAIRGSAGTVVFYNIGIYHTRNVGANDAGRRTLHQYFSCEPNPPLTNWALIPQRLAEHPDLATCAYYSHWTDLMREYAAANFDPQFYREHIGAKAT